MLTLPIKTGDHPATRAKRAVDDPVARWLNAPLSPPDEEPGHPSYRMAAEEAVRCFEEIAAKLGPREKQEAYIHLLVGRGFAARHESSAGARE